MKKGKALDCLHVNVIGVLSSRTASLVTKRYRIHVEKYKIKLGHFRGEPIHGTTESTG